ncbi:MAG TPA: hypothetical protein VEH27_00580 [Methylomirabilota bacterium]|nr:hypothetical protein [Methylomirabilota bacterium]
MAAEAFVEVSTAQPFWLLVVSEQARAGRAVCVKGVEFNYERNLVADVAREHRMDLDSSAPGEIRLRPRAAAPS